MTGPCSVGKEATREAQKPGIPRRSGLARSDPGAARASFMSIFAQDLDPGALGRNFSTIRKNACTVAALGSDIPDFRRSY